MSETKKLTYAKLGQNFIIVGIVFSALGILLGWLQGVNATSKAWKEMYDLPWFILIIGIGFVIHGFMKWRTYKEDKTAYVDLSSKGLKKFLLNNGIILALVAMVIGIMIMEHRFIQLKVLRDILAQASPRMIIALGICFTLLIAGTDLSACRMVGLAAVISASMMQNPDYPNRFFPNLPQLPVIVPVILAIFACMLFGLLNGFLVAKFDMHPFIATLAVQVIIYGACSLYFDLPPNNSQPIGGIRKDFAALGQKKLFTEYLPDKIGGIPILIPIALVFIIVIWFILNKTVFGKNVYAIGGNREAAIVSGINVPATIVCIFVLASALYGVGGVLEAARTAGATNNYGVGYELDAIAACVVGGVSLNGGVGKVSGIIVGVLIFTIIQYGLQFIGINAMWQQVIKGIIIAIAVAIDLSKYRRK
jgi:methyl-galactoside transport system permease protein